MYLKAALPPIPEEMTYNHHPLDHCRFVAASAVIYWYLHGWFFFGHRILEHMLFYNGFIQPWLYIGNICLLVSVCSLWTLSPALASFNKKNLRYANWMNTCRSIFRKHLSRPGKPRTSSTSQWHANGSMLRSCLSRSSQSRWQSLSESVLRVQPLHRALSEVFRTVFFCCGKMLKAESHPGMAKNNVDSSCFGWA